ncbi:hypothetical protein DFAR_630043 [Desulfarculales bacterium]
MVSIVAYIYKDCWKIELFSKALKQNFKVKIFVASAATPWKSRFGQP